MRELFDADGNAVQVPDEAELAALTTAKDEAEKLKQDIETLKDTSPEGMKRLREALGRKEELIAKLQGQVNEERPKPVDLQEVSKTATEAARKVLVDAEVAKAITHLSEDEAKIFKAKFEKLTAGEDVNLETVHVYVQEAERAAFPDKTTRSAPPRSGKGPRTEDKPTKFGETEEGKAFAERMGLKIEPPAKK